MNRKHYQSVRLFAFCLWAIAGIHNLRAQSTNAPVLSLAPGASPALTVTGIPGASYQVQFASQLAASNQWTALTNILLSNSAYLLHDPAAASNAARFYRALLLSSPSNIFNGYAPSQIFPGEVYQFITPNSFGVTTTTQAHFISSATNGIWMGAPPPLSAGAYSVSLNFTQLSDLTIQLDITFPATSTNSPPNTNSYVLAFTGTNAGVFVGPLGSPQSGIGNFSRITNLIGTTVVPQLAAGEVWNLSASNTLGQSSTATLVMDSPTSGWWVAGGSISPATAQFAPQGPLGGNLVVVGPSSFPVTNTFVVEFDATNSGLFLGALPGLGSAVVGTFTHDTTMVGKTIAPPQLVEGETYQLSLPNGFVPSPGPVMIAMESSDAGWMAFPASQGPSALVPGSVQYSQLGPFSGNLSVIGFFNPPSTNLITNTCLLVYTATNSGFVLATLGPPTPGIFGTFVRNTAFIGQTLAPQQLTTGDTYQLTTTSESFPPSQSFTVNSATDGLWQTVQQPSLNTIDATLQYNRIGPLSGTLTAVYPATVPPSTNTYTLLFTGYTTGLFEGPDSPGSSTQAGGIFLRNATLENQTFVPAQLTGGEIYQLVVTNGLTTSTQTLIVNSATSGLLVVPGGLPVGGIFAASIQYVPLGAFGANLTLMVGGGSNPFTNTYLLDFASSLGGVFQVSPSIPGKAGPGGFLRSTALVGQSFAPQQLVDGESYQFTYTNQPVSSPQTLILTSATNGLWTASGGTGGGIFSVPVQYTGLGPLGADLSVIIPPGVITLAGSTNSFTMIFNSATNGIFESTDSSSASTFGTFVHGTP